MEPGFPDGIHTMRLPDGSFLFPDNEYDAEDFAADGAVPVFPDLFPFDVEPKIVRARVTLTFDIRHRRPLEVTEHELALWVMDRMGRVTDNGPYAVPRSWGIGDQEIDFGAICGGEVSWADGSAPEHGFHCADCRTPKDPDAGPCTGTVPWGTGTRPCQSDDAQHHGRCFHEQVLGPVPMPKRMP